MRENEIKEVIERFKLKAKRLFDKGESVYIRDVNNIYYFANITKIEEEYIEIFTFSGFNTNSVFRLYWEDIMRLKEYIKPIYNQEELL